MRSLIVGLLVLTSTNSFAACFHDNYELKKEISNKLLDLGCGKVEVLKMRYKRIKKQKVFKFACESSVDGQTYDIKVTAYKDGSLSPAKIYAINARALDKLEIFKCGRTEYVQNGTYLYCSF